MNGAWPAAGSCHARVTDPPWSVSLTTLGGELPASVGVVVVVGVRVGVATADVAAALGLGWASAVVDAPAPYGVAPGPPPAPGSGRQDLERDDCGGGENGHAERGDDGHTAARTVRGRSGAGGGSGHTSMSGCGTGGSAHSWMFGCGLAGVVVDVGEASSAASAGLAVEDAGSVRRRKIDRLREAGSGTAGEAVLGVEDGWVVRTEDAGAGIDEMPVVRIGWLAEPVGGQGEAGLDDERGVMLRPGRRDDDAVREAQLALRLGDVAQLTGDGGEIDHD